MNAMNSPGTSLPSSAIRTPFSLLFSLGRLIRVSHSLFALPFALASAVLVADEAALSLQRLALVVICIVCARTAAMTMNRIADQRFDAANPRTQRRELVTGQVSRRSAVALLVASSIFFIAASALLSPLCGACSLPVLAVLFGYSYAKRFTWAVHLWLGVAQALAPIGVGVALTGKVIPATIVLGLAVGAWVAGFDIIYSLQDESFDRLARLHSIPAHFGTHRALWAARLLHLCAAPLFFGAGRMAGAPMGWALASALMTVALLGQHLYLTPKGVLRTERVGTAFFNWNAFASVAFFGIVALGRLVHAINFY